MTALIAVDAREPLVKITTFEKAFEDHGPILSFSDDLTAGCDGRAA